MPSNTNTLPLQPTPFIGRSEEIADIVQMLANPTCRLLTLIGLGGIGKTCLALQIAKKLDSFRHGIHFVPLQHVHSTDFLASAIADALNISLSGHEKLEMQLLNILRNKEMLLLLDNFEHLLDGVELISDILREATAVKLLITSREVLNLQEEWLYPVQGLPVPTSDQHDDLETFPAAQLFIERAQRGRRDFSPANERAAISRICQLVGGMPLALELAASWITSLHCEAIADQIQRNIDFLATRSRNVPERHRSMHAAFDQSWQHLSPRTRLVFQKLSVFKGGFLFHAAEQVTGVSLLTLSMLVDKSLLRREVNGRYQIHELLRQYAAEQLEKNDSDVQQTQSDHANYYIQFLHQRSDDIAGGRQREALLEIKEELDNIRLAWLWAIAHIDADALQKGSQSLGLYYQYQGRYLEGLTLFSQVVNVLQGQIWSEATDLALLRTLMYKGWYHLRFGHLEATEACMGQSLTIYRRLNIPPLPGYLSDPNAPLGFVALTRGDYVMAVQYAEKVRQVAEAEQHIINREMSYHLLAEANLGLGAYETAQKFAQQAYAQAIMSGDRWFMAYILNNMGQIAVALGDYKMGKTHFQSSYEIREQFADPEMALSLINLGNLALKEQDFVQAEELYQRSHTIYQDINDKGGLAAAKQGLGIISCEQGDYVLAQDYFGQALRLAIEIDYRPVSFGLLLNIAQLLWQIGQRERPITLLAFTAHHPATDHETRTKAKTRLTLVYRKMVTEPLFETAVDQGEASDLEILTADLFHQLSLPPTQISAKAPSPAGSTKPAQALVEPLTPRELEVLNLLCAGLTNQEIADELVLAVGTIKFYTSQIYGKLGVRNRITAVARARELNLLS